MSVSQVVSVSQASQTGGEVGALLDELGALTGDARNVFGRLSAAQLNWKPSARQWSVGQCFDHLIKTNDTFCPTLEETARGGRDGTLWERVSPLSGFFGRLIMRAIKSPRKFKAPRGLRPSASDVDAGVIERFSGRQGELAGLMRAAAGAADLQRTVVTSPIAGFVTFSLLDAYRIIVAHERNHFEQARRVTEAEGFPAA
jgi:hypothetical protein